MRVWNSADQALVAFFSRVLELPMRVWNFWVSNGTPSSTISFGVTYEGLKLYLVQCMIGVLYGCFGVTYEGLKPRVNPLQPMILPGFGVTYEGLKLAMVGIFMPAGLIVLELPMRVWNWRRGTHRRRRSRVLELPMRVWNHLMLAFYCKPCYVLELPMRVWNRNFGRMLLRRQTFWSYLWGFETRHGHGQDSHSHVLELPMRVWNWNCCIYRTHGRRRFWSYLWGFETTCHPGRTATSRKFWSYLWGFETGCLLRLRLLDSISFGVTYEGLKHGVQNDGFHLLERFWSYLWGFETRRQ